MLELIQIDDKTMIKIIKCINGSDCMSARMYSIIIYLRDGREYIAEGWDENNRKINGFFVGSNPSQLARKIVEEDIEIYEKATVTTIDRPHCNFGDNSYADPVRGKDLMDLKYWYNQHHSRRQSSVSDNAVVVAK